jgi:dipeptidase E
MKNICLASTSTVHGKPYLSYMHDEMKILFSGIDEVVFVPYAQPGGISYDGYTAKAQEGFDALNIKVKGVHTFDNPFDAIKQANGIFVGGGNTFLLLKTLYENNLIECMRDVVNAGTPYLGTSAGSNIAGVNVRNTNDMPIIYPPSFDAMGLIPFNINPHYLDPDPTSKHMGETRETRINEFHAHPDNDLAVLGIREGSWIRVKGDEITLGGELNARLFKAGQNPLELATGSDLTGL